MATGRWGIDVPARRGGAQFRQQPILVRPALAGVPQHEEALDHLIEALESVPREPVAAAQAVGSHGDEVRVTKKTQLIRDGGLADVELRTQLLDNAPDREFTARKQFDDAETNRVSQKCEGMHQSKLGSLNAAAREASTAHQETGSALPSSYPAALWMPTVARSWNAGRSAAPA